MIVAELEDPTLGMPEQSAHAATRGWFMATTDLAPYADALVTVGNGRIVGSFGVVAHQQTGIGRVLFQLETWSRLAFLIGQPAPFGVSADPEFALCISTDLVLRHSQRRQRALSRKAVDQTSAAPRRQRHSRDLPRVAGAPTNTVD